jgi:hypothetical protein
MRRWLCVAVLGLALLLAGAPAAAQVVALDSVNTANPELRHLVRLRDGTTLVGRILGVTPDSVRVEIASGQLVVPRASVLNVRQIESARLRNGEYWFENPHSTRLLFSSTAFPLERGTGYYSNTWLVLHTFATGLTDRFTLGGGLLWFPGVSLDETLMYLLPKYTVIDGPQTKVAVGALAGILPLGSIEDGDPWTAGILYGVGTTGTRDNNLSLGVGWGYAGDDLASRPIVMVGGQARLSRRLSLISENWFIPVDRRTEGIGSIGLRFLSEGITADLAYAKPFGSDVWFPWLGFAFRF